jgi:hypothetical protein
MPTIDFDLHPMALAFGIFCFLLTSGLLAAVVYMSIQSSDEPATTDSAQDFVPPSARSLDTRTSDGKTFNAPAYDRETGVHLEMEAPEMRN